jgi:hypothetical protein
VSDKQQLITSRDQEGVAVYDFRCPYPNGCGQEGSDGHVSFQSTGWHDHDHAAARARQHLDEHESGEAMPSLHEFRVERGLTPEAAGVNVNPDDWEF